MKSLYLVSLGCPKNLVDSEIMLGILTAAGYVVVDIPEEASLIVVNTCGFIQPAVEEAIDEVLALAVYKEQRPDLQLVVTGCMVQRYGLDLKEALPEVDLFLGLDHVLDIAARIQDLPDSAEGSLKTIPATYLMDSLAPRRLSTPFFRAYLKITEGCDNCCSYCMIPSIRGRLRSRTIEDLVTEARMLEQHGVQELSLIAQDLTAYGDDVASETDLQALLQQLLAQTTIPWIRLLYLYPSGITAEFLEFMAQESARIVPYLDVPFQHVSDSVLQAMNRPYGLKELDALVEMIRRIHPACVIRTTLMVGFPGETEQDILQMESALGRWKLDHVGVFQYQDEDGSVSATLQPKVSPEEKQARYDRVMAVQNSLSTQLQQQYVGTIEPVLVEGVSQETELLLEGRTRFQAPEIDGCVYITSGQVNPGDIVPVRITEAHTYDLVGEILMPEED